MRLITILLASVLLAACASGVKMTDEDAARCRAEGCTVWTDAELQGLAEYAFRRGLQQGAQSRGRSL